MDIANLINVDRAVAAPELPREPEEKPAADEDSWLSKTEKRAAAQVARLADAPPELAQTILVALCNDDDVRAKALQHLNDLEKRIAATAQQDDGAPAATKKRKASPSTLHICVRCLEPYSEADNGDEACTFHDGDLEMDEDSSVWNDYPDGGCAPEMDSQENREEYPQGFMWNCCDELGDTKGCAKGRHTARNAQRGRYTRPDLNLLLA